ncbi:MAG: FHIPEP family type III secretion protein [Planctomycetes bacterium]|nr:FHIPEP family type III secretion protein [Planctomycetota bacterium]
MADGDTILAVGFLAILTVLVVPLPQVLLDLLIGTNISVSLLILVATIKAREPLDISTFPSLILFATLFRLSLNVASARLILLDGDAGSVITAFGNFVVGGNLFVGVVIFLILVIVQFVVITKGATRVSEVAARFTLDALPGKQMAIDADLNAGHIGEPEARRRRARVGEEAEFHGAMDGASKFVRGDAIAGLLIVVLEVLGGLAMGLTQGMGISEALHKYSILTIGDGLVTQIPALLIATAAAVITVKSSSRSQLSEDLGAQLLGQPGVLLTVGGMVLVLALAPGLPKLPFFVIAAGAFALHSRWGQGQAAPAEHPASESALVDDAAAVDTLREALHLDRLCLELGFGLVPLADTERGGTVIERVSLLRKQIAGDWGWLVPPVRVRENLEIDANAYRLLIGGHEVASGTLEPGRYLAIGAGVGSDLEGIHTREPSFGLPATWVEDDDRATAELRGFTLADPTTVLITHLGEVLRGDAAQVLTRDDVQELLDALKETAPAVVNEVTPQLLSLGEVQRVLTALLEERVSIRQLQTILEAIADQAAVSKDTDSLVNAARQRISRAVIAPLLDVERKLPVLTLEPKVERRLLETLLRAEGIGAEGPFLHGLVEATALKVREVAEGVGGLGGRDPALVVQESIRAKVSRLLRHTLPRLGVVSYAELGGAPSVESVGVVSLGEAST